MSDKVFGGDDFEDGDDFESDSGGGTGGKRILIIVVGLILLLLAGGIAYLVMSGMLSQLLNGSEQTETRAQPAMAGGDGFAGNKRGQAATSSETPGGDGSASGSPAYFYPPDMLVNLDSKGGRNRFLKVSIVLELRNSGGMTVVENNLPRIIDMFQNYLHSLSVERLQAGAGLDRLREELQKRANDAITGSDPVSRVLIQEALVQ